MATAKNTPAKNTNPNTSVSLFAAAAIAFAGAIGSGAEVAPKGTYTFPEDANGPKLIGGKWAQVDGKTAIVPETVEATDTQKGYTKSVKVVAQHSNGQEYRISLRALADAYKGAGKELHFGETEMGQEVATNGAGYPIAKVVF